MTPFILPLLPVGLALFLVPQVSAVVLLAALSGMLMYETVCTATSEAIRNCMRDGTWVIIVGLLVVPIAWTLSFDENMHGLVAILYCVLVILTGTVLIYHSYESYDPWCLMAWSVHRRRGWALCGAVVVGCLSFCLIAVALRTLKHWRNHQLQEVRRWRHGKGRWDLHNEWEPETPGVTYLFSLWLSFTLLGAWIGPSAVAILESLASSDPRDSWNDVWDRVSMRLCPESPAYLRPIRLRYSTDTILSRARNRDVVQAPRSSYVIRAVIHRGFLFALDNYTLHAAQHNSVDEVLVYIVSKPKQFKQLFTHRREESLDWYSVEVVYEENPALAHLQMRASDGLRFRALVGEPCAFRQARPEAMRVPAEAFYKDDIPLRGSVVLMADRVVRYGEKLEDILRSKYPNLEVKSPPEGKRSYACVRVPLAHEASVREAIKAIGRERGTRSVNIKAVPGTLVFDSPRD